MTGMKYEEEVKKVGTKKNGSEKGNKKGQGFKSWKKKR